MHIYRIRRKTDGKFSTGHVTPDFAQFKKGKVWRSIRALKLHIRLVREGEYYHGIPKEKFPYDDCDIITYEATETELDNFKEPFSLKDYANE